VSFLLENAVFLLIGLQTRAIVGQVGDSPVSLARILLVCLAALVAVIPLYVVGLLSSYFATRLVVTGFFGQSEGTYDHYFELFLPPGDVLWSFGKVLVFAVVVIMIHCYHGYNASGGPVGVGTATAKSMVLNIVLVHLIGMLGTQLFWGANPRAPIGG